MTLVVHSNDHPPPHVHVQIKGEPKLEFKVNLETAEVIGTVRGIKSNKLAGMVAAVIENRDTLAGWWEKYQGTSVSIPVDPD
ncbi:hypothetical protein GCM10009582_11290 [Arthrobacter flavus]